MKATWRKVYPPFDRGRMHREMEWIATIGVPLILDKLEKCLEIDDFMPVYMEAKKRGIVCPKPHKRR